MNCVQEYCKDMISAGWQLCRELMISLNGRQLCQRQ